MSAYAPRPLRVATLNTLAASHRLVRSLAEDLDQLPAGSPLWASLGRTLSSLSMYLPADSRSVDVRSREGAKVAAWMLEGATASFAPSVQAAVDAEIDAQFERADLTTACHTMPDPAEPLGSRTDDITRRLGFATTKKWRDDRTSKKRMHEAMLAGQTSVSRSGSPAGGRARPVSRRNTSGSSSSGTTARSPASKKPQNRKPAVTPRKRQKGGRKFTKPRGTAQGDN